MSECLTCFNPYYKVIIVAMLLCSSLYKFEFNNDTITKVKTMSLKLTQILCYYES